MPTDEFADVVHLSVNNEPPLFFTPRALGHFVPGEVALGLPLGGGLPLGRGLGSHRGRATTRAGWVAAVRSTHRPRGVARAGLAGSGSGSAGARPEPCCSSSYLSSCVARERVPASPPAPLGRALGEGRGRLAGGRIARPLAGSLPGSPPDPTFRLEPFRLELTGGAAAWITVPVKTPGCGARIGEEGA